MANLRKDEKSVYIDLWGETLEYDRIQYALYQLNSAFELRISEDTDTILNYRLNGVPYKVSTVNGQQTNDICPYSWESLEYVGKTIEEAGRCANEILAEYGIELNPNWKEINKQWLTEVDRLEKLFGDALGKATQAALNNQAYKYQQAYNEELSKDFGLSFGVLSSSLTAHLLYAAQSAAKERKDHARAERVASEVMQNSHADITAQIFASVYPIYVDSLEPTMQKLLSQYYAYIISIFSKELGCSYDDVIATFNFERSNDFILSKTESVKNNILQALQVDPNNGNVIGYAIRNGILDEELCEHGKNATPNFDITLKKWAISALSEIHTAGKLFNKPLITDENKGIITGLKTYYKYQCANLEKCRDWQNIVLSVFTEEASKHLVEWGEISTAIASMLIPEEFDKLAKSGKRFYIDDKSKVLFVDLYHELSFDGAYTSASFLELTPPFSVEDIDKKLNEYNEKLKLRSVELSRQAEQERKEEEARKEAQRIIDKQRKAELEKQKENRKAKIKKNLKIWSIIVAVLIVVVLLFNALAVPPIYYNLATSKLQEQQYGEAAILYSKAGNYKDATELCKASWNNVQNKLITSGGGTFGIALKENGEVVAAGNNDGGQCDVGTWNEVVAVAAGYYHAVGLKKDGTVIATGKNSDGECLTSDWNDIVAIAAGDGFTVGLQCDGTVVAVGNNDWGQCDVSSWKNIIAIAAGDYHTVGLKKDGTVVCTKIIRGEGASRAGTPYFGQTDVSAWTNIIAIDANEFQTIGLKDDGTVVSTIIDSSVYSVWQPYYHNQDNLSNWKDIVAISVGRYHVVGLKSDGTIVSTQFVNGDWGDEGQCDVSSWENIVAVAAGADFTIGIKSDGTSIIAGHIDTSWYTTPGTIPQKYWKNDVWSNLKRP